MLKRLFQILTGVLLIVGLASPSWAALQAVGPVSGPHGFPLYYTDTNNLSLELCLDEGWCFFDPVDPADPNQVALGVGGEVFWWMGEAVAPVASVDKGRAVLVLGIEGTFGGAEAVVNGQQITFGRVRVRVDVPVDGNYTVTHPFGTMAFNNVTVADGINYTADIGAANFFDVAAGFAGTLQSNIGPFLTWPDYQNDPALQVRGPAGTGGEPGPLLAQYVGNLGTPHVVTGSPFGNNFFRVTGPNGVIAETNLFGVMGKVYDGKVATAHVYPEPPLPNLVAVGPINRLDDFGANGSVVDLTSTFFPDGGFVADGTIVGYPLGYPTYYQDATGLQLTICQGGNPMCISDPVNVSDPAQKALNTGGETFFWSADAAIEEAGVDALLVLGTEGTFGGSEALIDGQQISFGRTRIRIDTPVAGNYTVIYPYGMKQFNNVPAGKDAINFTADIGIADPADPDYAFVGALFSEIGPNFLTWTSFDSTLLNNDPRLVKQEQAVNLHGSPILVGDQKTYNTIHYVGDPAIEHAVKGGTFEYEGAPVNYFRVIGPNIDVRTNSFVVSGRVYNPATFRTVALATTPVANADIATTITTTPVNINVLANDTLAGATIDPTNPNVVVARILSDISGTVVLNPDKSFTYTANPGFVGTDTFDYNVSINGEGAIATVTVTVQPVENFGVNRAQLDLRKLRWDIRGTGNATTEGQTLTVRLNSATGTVIGTTTVTGGLWRLNATSTTAPPTGTVQVYVVPSRVGAPVSGPFNVQVR